MKLYLVALLVVHCSGSSIFGALSPDDIDLLAARNKAVNRYWVVCRELARLSTAVDRAEKLQKSFNSGDRGVASSLQQAVGDGESVCVRAEQAMKEVRAAVGELKMAIGVVQAASSSQ